MKKRLIAILLSLGYFVGVCGSSLLHTYKNSIQQKIDQNIPVTIATFTDFIEKLEQSLEDESQKFMGFKSSIKNIVTFVKNISLQESTIIENSVPEYNESFTIQAEIEVDGQRMPVRFTVASHVYDIEHYSFAVQIPNEVKIADFGTFEMKFFDNFFKNRWIVFTLFDYKDPSFGLVTKGLNIIADSDASTVEKNIGLQLEWLKKLIGRTVPSLRFSGSVPLTILGLIPFFAGSSLPQGVTFEMLQSLLRFKTIINVDKTLYKNNQKSAITAVELESCDVVVHWGAGTALRERGFNVSSLLTFEFGTTIRVKTALGGDIVTHGSIEFKPLGIMVHTTVEGEIKNPFGIPWVSLYNVGIDFPLDLAGLAITGIGIRAEAGIGESRFEVAGKGDLRILNNSSLVLHGKAKKIPFSSFTQFIRDDNQALRWFNSLELDHANITIACGDTRIAEKEFKSGITILAQVGHSSILDKKAGFQLYAYNTGTYYQLSGNGYLPKINTHSIIFEGVNTGLNNQLLSHEGPRLEFSYGFDFAFEKFMQAVVKAKGRIKIGSFFDGRADIDLNTVTGLRNAVSDWKNFFIALLKDQKLMVKGKLFKTFAAELEIVDLIGQGIYTKVSFSQKLLSRWEKTVHQMMIRMKDSLEKNIESLDKQINELTSDMDKNALKALERATSLAQENEALRKENRDLQERIKKVSWSEIYKVIPLKLKKGYNATLIASNADLLNTILIHASWTETTASTFGQLRKAKNSMLALIEGVARLATVGIGLLGIEKVEAQGWLKEMLYQDRPLFVRVKYKLMGQEKEISNIPFDGSRPLESIKNLIRAIISNMLNENVPDEIVKGLNISSEIKQDIIETNDSII